MVARQIELPVRNVVNRTRGRTRGPITRLMSPSDLGHVVKPFVFLDLAVFGAGEERMRMEDFWHPHSGIATVTVVLEGSIRFAETTGRDGSLPAGGIEWMRAGNGVWHTGAAGEGRVRAFQLWVALPPELGEWPLREPVPDAGRGSGRRAGSRRPRKLRRREEPYRLAADDVPSPP